MEQKYCIMCEQTLDIEKFFSDKQKNKVFYWCLSCVQRHRDYKKGNHEPSTKCECGGSYNYFCRVQHMKSKKHRLFEMSQGVVYPFSNPLALREDGWLPKRPK